MTNPCRQYPNKKHVKFDVTIGKTFQTDSPGTYFEKHRESFDTDNYTYYVGNGAIYYGGAGCGKTWRLCELAFKAPNPIMLSFTNKAIENVKFQFKTQYPNSGLEKECFTFNRYFCDSHGRDISSLEGKTICIEEYSMTLNKLLRKMYQEFFHNITMQFICSEILTNVNPWKRAARYTMIISNLCQYMRCVPSALR